MAIRTSARRLLVALLVGAQAWTFFLIAAGPAFAVPCPAHAAVAPAVQQDAAGHRGHAAPESPPAAPGDDRTHPMTFGLACCAAHVVGVFACPAVLASAEVSARPESGAGPALTPGELPSVDPPPKHPL
jgi:hypothetical protein